MLSNLRFGEEEKRTGREKHVKLQKIETLKDREGRKKARDR